MLSNVSGVTRSHGFIALQIASQHQHDATLLDLISPETSPSPSAALAPAVVPLRTSDSTYSTTTGSKVIVTSIATVTVVVVLAVLQ
jgi:hypothetical protein